MPNVYIEEALTKQGLFFLLKNDVFIILKIRVKNMPFYERKRKNVIFHHFLFPFQNFRKEGLLMLENKFQAKLIKEIKETFRDCIVMKNDSSYIQGIPDLIILYRDRWAALEVKKSARANRQPNQEYYVELMDQMSFSRFICPENKDEVLDELYLYFTY